VDFLAPYWNGLIINPITDGIELFSRALGSYAFAIIAFTIFIKLCLLPLTLKQVRSQKAMQSVAPLLAEAKKKHGNDRTALSQETMQIYKENKINPAAGCLPLFIQMPILIGLYQALIGISNKGELSAPFLWVHSLALPDTWMGANPAVGITHNGLFILPVLAGVTQFIQQRMMMMPTTDPQQKMMNQIMQFMPLMIIYFGFTFPAGLALYWVTSTSFAIVQQYFITGWGMLLPGTRFSTIPKPAAVVSPARSLTATASPIPGRTEVEATVRESDGTPPTNGTKDPITTAPTTQRNQSAKRSTTSNRPRAATSKTAPATQRRQGGKR